MSARSTDPVAAAVYRREAEQHYEAARKSRQLGNKVSEQLALNLARWADDTAHILETGTERRSTRTGGRTQ